MTDSPYIHHSPTLRRLLGTAVVFPDLEHHQQWSSGMLLGLATGRHRPVDARGGRSPPSCQEKAGKGAQRIPRFVPPARRSRAQPLPGLPHGPPTGS